MSAKADPVPEPEPVAVFSTPQESEAMIVQGLLTSAGIECMVSNLGVDQALWPSVAGVAVLVNPSQAEEARQIIAEYNNAPPDPELTEDKSTE
jgi:Putative prokaryotic signal transducing protein